MAPPSSLAALAGYSNKVKVAVADTSVPPTTKFLMALFATGAALVSIASALDIKGVIVPGNGLRWLYLFGVAMASMIILDSLVEFVYLWLELKFFLRLVMLPSAHLMCKVWLTSVAAFVSFDRLFRDFTVGDEPPQLLTVAERWVRRLLICWLLSSCMSMAISGLCHLVVALFYSEGSRQKIVAAMQCTLAHFVCAVAAMHASLFGAACIIHTGRGGGSDKGTAENGLTEDTRCMSSIFKTRKRRLRSGLMPCLALYP
ncbi:hypothetical protein VOLCADRAFT_96528 [Volvox carteri f. nagariensis]|uniref:Uncharacterized protein n=1 Tax=Volvox carteri f. nagariensis TaxID=3068 RepID=D8UAC4_VOLCA|nr:uncharacterized protein VOLCADRAFT_96528 [Volvox carteri f. nagariensis]EFJ43292.1 hypothetical protein VOLCADRAFT_96528 [Volvox carteri f. nagariensis]|eukprot:XP_002955652.1 hypothetical protein VOLCADRAFT_96528 [Volvox carteri f. nagariensis]